MRFSVKSDESGSIEWLGRLVSLAGKVSEKGKSSHLRLCSQTMDVVVDGGVGEGQRLWLRLALGEFFTPATIVCDGYGADAADFICLSLDAAELAQMFASVSGPLFLRLQLAQEARQPLLRAELRVPSLSGRDQPGSVELKHSLPVQVCRQDVAAHSERQQLGFDVSVGLSQNRCLPKLLGVIRATKTDVVQFKVVNEELSIHSEAEGLQTKSSFPRLSVTMENGERDRVWVRVELKPLLTFLTALSQARITVPLQLSIAHNKALNLSVTTDEVDFSFTLPAKDI